MSLLRYIPGALLAAAYLAAILVVEFGGACAHSQVAPPDAGLMELNLDDAGPLPYPDAGEVNPCRASMLLTPEERRLFCIHEVSR